MTASRLVFALQESHAYVRVSVGTDFSSLQIPPETEVLSLAGTSIDDQALIALPVLKHLRCLDLDGTGVTDKCMGWVASLPVLEELWLECTSVTDAGLRELERSKSLCYVSVAYTAITSSSLAGLRGARPGIELSGP